MRITDSQASVVHAILKEIDVALDSGDPAEAKRLSAAALNVMTETAV